MNGHALLAQQTSTQKQAKEAFKVTSVYQFTHLLYVVDDDGEKGEGGEKEEEGFGWRVRE